MAGQRCFSCFFTNSATEVWAYTMEEYYKVVKYDGIWIDMNEPAMTKIMENNLGKLLKMR